MHKGCNMHAEVYMPSLQVRDLPEDIYNQLSYLAKLEHRSLAQETIVLLREGIESRMGNKTRRKILLESFSGLGVELAGLPTPEEMIREDRDSR